MLVGSIVKCKSAYNLIKSSSRVQTDFFSIVPVKDNEHFLILDYRRCSDSGNLYTLLSSDSVIVELFHSDSDTELPFEVIM